MKIITELQKAIAEGHHVLCEFIDGQVFCSLWQEKIYFISQVSVSARSCLATETIVYRIVFPNGLKGFAILEFEDDDYTLY